MGELILVRHGETEWTRSGQIGGRTDLPLTDAGVVAGRALDPVLARRHLVAAFSSPLSRDLQMAELVGLTGVKDAPAGQLLRHPRPGTVSALGHEHEQPVISVWNLS